MAAARTLRWNELTRRLEREGVRGTYAFCGPEAFLKQEAQKTLLAATLGKGGAGEGARYALATFQLGEQGIDEILGAASQGGLFGAERVVWVEGLERAGRLRPKDREAWLAALGRENANPIVLSSPELSHELRKRTKFHTDLLARVTVVDFWSPRPAEATEWLRRRAEKRGLQLTPAAAEKIVGHLGTDLLTLAQEVEKISLLHGEGGLGVEDLREMVRLGLLGSAWESVEAALAGRHQEALQGLQTARREETAFSFNWKLSFSAAQWLGSASDVPSRAAGSWSPRAGVQRPAPSPRMKKLLGRMLGECYEWERRMKSGRWPGAHDYDALEAVVIAHAARMRGGSGGEQVNGGARHVASD